jgi:ArsR family metal-binding transcriptional regulator
MPLVTTFPTEAEADRARSLLAGCGLSHRAISPAPGYGLVGVAALVVEPEARGTLAAESGRDLVCSGWADYRPARIEVPQQPPPEFQEDVFGRAAVMVLAPCVADETKIRIVAHISGDLTKVFPYLNAEMRQASYSVHGPTFTFMDGYRMVSAYPRRVAVAKTDEIVDSWRVLEELRRRVNGTWARRHEIEPSYERREKPPALEIYKRLPRTNCGACGERACLAFAVKVHGRMLDVGRCRPVFDGGQGHLRDALLEICKGLGVTE